MTTAHGPQLDRAGSTANGTLTPYPELCAHKLFEAQVARFPERIAVTCGKYSLSYAELDKRSEYIAERLRAANIGAEARVGIYLRRSVEMIAGLLGIHKAGGAYVPIDPSHPEQRRSYVISDAGLSALLTENSLLDSLPDRSLSWAVVPDVNTGRDGNGIQLLAPRSPSPKRSDQGEPTLNNTAYVIYTSGSTGNPKGVEVLHRGLTNLLCSMARDFGFSESDGAFAVSTLAFDIATLDLLMPLICGGRVIVAPDDLIRDGEMLKRAVESSGATFMQAGPATWRMLIDSGWKGSPGLKLCSGGEALSRSLANALLERCGGLWNYYGPTETTIYSTGCRIDTADGVVPIGLPIANTEVCVLDENRRPVPTGVSGELFIGGHGVARGYLNRPDLTAERFILTLISQRETRLYRTGDQVRFREDGSLEFLGRLDHQIKLRGFRIEPGEIEERLLSHPAVRSAIVVARDNKSADKQVVAYYVADDDKRPTVRELRGYLSASLPEYMIPARFVALAEMPLTPNRKVDRSALPDPDEIPPNLSSPYREPSTELQKRLAAIWSETLSVPGVGVCDDFFELGGHSLLAVSLLKRIDREYNIELPLIAIHHAPTVELMSKLLERNDSMAELSDRVTQLADGPGSRLFCIGGSGSDVLTLRELASNLDGLHPVYALQARGMAREASPLETVPDLAHDYLSLVRSVQSKGPYSFIGYSAGALVAFEMARALRQHGENTESLILLDPSIPRRRSGLLGLIDHAESLLRQSVYHVRKLSGIHVWEWARYAREKVRFAGLFKNVDEALGDRINVYHATNRAVREYTPTPFSASGLLIAATTRPDAFENHYGIIWPKLLRDGVTLRTVEGDHFNLLRAPRVRQVAQEIINYIQGSETIKRDAVQTGSVAANSIIPERT